MKTEVKQITPNKFSELFYRNYLHLFLDRSILCISKPNTHQKEHHMDTNKEYQVISTSKKGVSLFWWVFWLLIFWPMLILTAIIHFNSETVYHVQYRKHNGKIAIEKMTQSEYNEFVNR